MSDTVRAAAIEEIIRLSEPLRPDAYQHWLESLTDERLWDRLETHRKDARRGPTLLSRGELSRMREGTLRLVRDSKKENAKAARTVEANRTVTIKISAVEAKTIPAETEKAIAAQIGNDGGANEGVRQIGGRVQAPASDMCQVRSAHDGCSSQPRTGGTVADRYAAFRAGLSPVSRVDWQ